MDGSLTGSDKRVQMVRDHSHARILYKLWRSLDDERMDNIYTDDENQKIKDVVLLLAEKEDELKDKYDHKEWCALGCYELFG